MCRLNGPVPLQKSHNVDDFDCRVERLNDYLKKYALQNQRNQGSKTYVITDDNVVLGYFSLAFGSISFADAPMQVKQGLGKYPVPILILARLAVDKRIQGRGFGKMLLKHALLKTTQAAEIAGLRAVVVHARDEKAAAFYQHFGFEPSPLDSLHLFLLIKDIQAVSRLSIGISTGS